MSVQPGRLGYGPADDRRLTNLPVARVSIRCYTEAGVCTVGLTVSGSGGTDTYTRPDCTSATAEFGP